ncbi:UNVERIFIED_CONTAM: hypothetical protein K2H54_052998 [Gekko kuhli]
MLRPGCAFWGSYVPVTRPNGARVAPPPGCCRGGEQLQPGSCLHPPPPGPRLELLNHLCIRREPIGRVPVAEGAPCRCQRGRKGHEGGRPSKAVSGLPEASRFSCGRQTEGDDAPCPAPRHGTGPPRIVLQREKGSVTTQSCIVAEILIEVIWGWCIPRERHPDRRRFLRPAHGMGCV